MLAVRRLSRAGLSVAPFGIADGECVAVLGPSGSGKSMLLRAIADLDPNEGEIVAGAVARRQVPAPHWRRIVTYVPADSGWWADRVGEHFADGAAVRSLEAAVLLPPDCLDWPVGRLSTGERQRLALIRALVQHPQVLLLDEPTSGLDAAATAAVEALLLRCLAGGTSILMVTHDAGQAGRLAKRSLRVDNGVVREAPL